MITHPNGGLQVEDLDELPAIPRDGIDTLYADYETASNDPKMYSTNPWDREHCTALGVAIAWQNYGQSESPVWFVPRSILDAGGINWLQDCFSATNEWCNHNVKYDAHVGRLDLGIRYAGRYKCTIAQANIHDSDRLYKGGYGLDALALAFCDRNILPYSAPLINYVGKDTKNKNYGKIPLDVLAPYACEDVIATRELDKFFEANKYEGSEWVTENEIQLTSALIDMEINGLYIDNTKIKIQYAKNLKRMMEIAAGLAIEVGQEFLPNSSKDCHEILINQLGFPMIRAEGAKGEASFDKHVLKNYATMGGEFSRYSNIVKLIAEYRSLSTHNGLFWDAWLELADKDGVLHSDYNQNVSSGRTSARKPNIQQLDKQARGLVEARPGYVFLCYDYSQVEYRWMVHYMNNAAAIEAYNTNPKTDYHDWISEQAQIPRTAGKTLNFLLGFGGGKNRALAMLSTVNEVIARCKGNETELRREVLNIYETYHANLPELKKNLKMAENAAIQRGYVKTCYGRRLHLDRRFAYKGFNRVVQSTAADNAKEAIVAVSPVFNEKLRGLGVRLLALVHDEFLFEVPDDQDIVEAANEEIKRCLELPSARCKVPIIASCGKPANNWKDAKG